jgi:hypothetical protein
MENPSRARCLAEPTARRRWRSGFRILLESAYVLSVAAVAAWGFIAGTTAVILTAVALSLPTGLPALVGYYMVYGLLAQVPGANPSTFTGSFSCSPDGSCEGSTTGDLAPWFADTTVAVGVIALTAAALVNVAVLRFVTSKLRARRR